MRLLKFIIGTFAVTAFLLIYIHVQMEIFTLAYQRTAKEKQVRKWIERNGHLTNEILKLKSANYLGIKVLNEKSGMQFVDHEKILHIKAPKGYEDIRNEPSDKESSSKKTNPLVSLLSLSN